MGAPVDVCDLLREWLVAADHNVSCAPAPRGLRDELPMTLLEKVGGTRSSLVTDTHTVEVTTWAETPARALEEAGDVAADLVESAGAVVDGVQIYVVNIATVPYDVTDPDQPTLGCARSLIQVITRVKQR